MDNQLEVEIIKSQSNMIGSLTSENIELRIRLEQALQTAEALAKEVEAMNDGNTKQQQQSETADSEGSTDSDPERV